MCNYESVFTDNELKSIASEFARLQGKTYLDHSGASLYGETQIQSIAKDLTNNLYLNPHTSKHTTDCIDQVRYLVLNHFHTNSDEYSVIFTSGATQSLKIVAEAFDYNITKQQYPQKNGESKTGAFVYLKDNHTSVLGMREIATARSADLVCIASGDMAYQMAGHKQKIKEYSNFERGLFVFPAQCNFSGSKYPLNWINNVKNGALNIHLQMKTGKEFEEWGVLLDAAAFVSTNKLDLSIDKPDFVCLSFYKIFGYPTGLGALIVRNCSAHMLEKKTYYGGGTVEIAMSGIDFHVKRESLHERFEDGTISFLSILAIKHGFDLMNKLIPRRLNENIMDKVSQHTFNLAQYFYNQLTRLQHRNGKPVAHIYSDFKYTDITLQGGIVNFNLLRSNGDYIGFAEVMHMAELFNIYLRSGCFCNPGACQRFLNLTDEELKIHYKAGHICGDNNDLIDGTPTGSLRVSFGYMSTKGDADTCLNMIRECFVERVSILDESINNINVTFRNNLQMVNDLGNSLNHTTSKGILKEMHVYPLKSCAAFKTSKWEIGPKGLKFDREWMIITESGVALTQKQDTRMCLIQPSIDLVNNILELSFPGVENITIPLYETSHEIKKGVFCPSKVCGDKINGVDCGDDASQWLLDVLGIPGIRLIRQSFTEERRFKETNSSGKKLISLSNQAQYLAINLASVRWLAGKVQSKEFENKIDNLTRRFRGNLIIETSEEFEEFSWKEIKIGSVKFQMENPCTRCQMVCINQENGEKTIEPLCTISKEFQGKINFGVYLSHIKKTSEKLFLSSGDAIHEVSSK